MTEPKVVTLPFGGSELARVALAGEGKYLWYAPPPHEAEAWALRAHDTKDSGLRDWHSTLAPAFAARGAAAARLARSAQGRGVLVTTGQQPGLFGGPVYSWSKALSAVALADAIERSTGIPVAPVFWAATYDADYAEASASYVIVNGTLTKLQLPPPDRADAPMRDTPLAGVAPLLRLLEQASGSAVRHDVLDAVRAAYSPGQTIGLAYVQLLRAVLEPLGIAVLDAGHPVVRRAARPILQLALRRATSVDASLRHREDDLRMHGMEPPVPHVDGLSTVFRYENRARARIPIADASHIDDDVELEPNVLLRPVAERAILPTVAYLGGPGEVAYFAQSTAIAIALEAEMPVVLPRWSGMVIEPHVQRVLERHGLSPDDLRDPHRAESLLAREALPHAVRRAVDNYATAAEMLSAELHAALTAEGAAPLVPDAVVEGARNNISYRIKRLERRIIAAAKRRESSMMHDIALARAALYPLGEPQERVLNFIPMLTRHGQPLLDAMLACAREHAASLVGRGPAASPNGRTAVPR